MKIADLIKAIEKNVAIYAAFQISEQYLQTVRLDNGELDDGVKFIDQLCACDPRAFCANAGTVNNGSAIMLFPIRID